MKIDAHFHLIERLRPFCGRGEGRSLGDGRAEFANGDIVRFIPEAYGADCFTAEMGIELMDRHGIDMAVVLQGVYYGLQNGYTMEMARKNPGRFYPVGSFDPFCNQSERILDHLISDLGFRALKFEISDYAGLHSFHPGFDIEGKEMRPVFERANEEGMAIAFDVGGIGQGSYQIDGFARITRLYPNVRFVMCHLLCPKSADQDGWERDIKAMNPDNVWFDISSLPSFISEKAPYSASVSYVKKAFRVVGGKRLLWGSDAPGILNRFPYADILEYFHDAVPASALDDILGGNAVIAYAIPRRAARG